MKSESGFSLLEVILSLAALTLISGFILQMFIASLYLNQKAYNLDMGANAATQEMEACNGDSIADNGGGVTRYFDSQWNPIAIEGADTEEYTQNVNLILPENVQYIVTISISEDGLHEFDVYTSFDSSGGYIAGTEQAKEYRLDASVYQITESRERELLISLSTRKYI